MPLRPNRVRSVAIGDELVAEAGRGDERDVGGGRHRHRAVAVAGAGERRVGEEEHVAAVGDVVAVDHRRRDAHPHRCGAALGGEQLDAQRPRCGVGGEHLVGG